MPIGNGDLTKVLDALVEDATREGEPFCLLGICFGHVARNWKPSCPENSSSQQTGTMPITSICVQTSPRLPEKKFQSKRNHVNKFKRTYITNILHHSRDRIQECLDLEAEWCKANNCDQHEGTGKRTSRTGLRPPQF